MEQNNQNKQWKYFSANNTKRYIDILQDLIHKYNTTKHRAIGCTPTVARNPLSYEHVLRSLYAKKTKERKKKPKFKIGDQVRIKKKKKQFEKGFTPNWTEEIFTINTIKDTKPPTYIIQDLNGQTVKGTFYEPELQKTHQNTFRIEKVVRKRTTKDGVREAFVKWKGYTNNFNTWIPTTSLERL